MPKTATDGLEYLAPNDPADIAGGTKRLATTTQAAFDARDARLPYAMATGHVTITPNPNTPTGVHVDFPVGRFTVPPSVSVTPHSANVGEHVKGTSASAPTSTGMDIYIFRDNDANTGVDWIAVQMTPSSAEG